MHRHTLHISQSINVGGNIFQYITLNIPHGENLLLMEVTYLMWFTLYKVYQLLHDKALLSKVKNYFRFTFSFVDEVDGHMDGYDCTCEC